MWNLRRGEFFSALEFSLRTEDILLSYVSVIGTLKKRRSTKPLLFELLRERCPVSRLSTVRDFSTRTGFHDTLLMKFFLFFKKFRGKAGIKR